MTPTRAEPRGAPLLRRRFATLATPLALLTFTLLTSPSPQAEPSRAPPTPAWIAPSADGPRAEPHWPGDMLGLTSPLPPRTYFARSRFEMGSTADEKTRAFTDCVLEIYGHTCQGSDFDDEGPVRHVELSPFWLDRHEVTVAEYERCVGAHRCVAVPYFKGGERFRRAHLPVSLVTWHEARDYCAFAGGRLPTEAEWERAARGRHSRRYPWGNAYNPRVSNHGRLAFDSSDAVDGFAELAPVGAFPDGATPERVFDLAGNVEEWTWDRYADEYDADDTSDPRGPPVTSGEVERSVRGGSFTSPQVHLRTAARAFALPTERDITRGFRCARSATR